MAKLLDTSFLIAYHNKRDLNHEKAHQLEIQEAAINDHIYNEITNIIHSRQGHKKAVEYGGFLREAVNIIRVSQPVFEKAVENFESKEISFTDASLAATAQKTGVKKIAAFDKDFDSFENIEKIPRTP